jgi:hypothetical protein
MVTISRSLLISTHDLADFLPQAEKSVHFFSLGDTQMDETVFFERYTERRCLGLYADNHIAMVINLLYFQILGRFCCTLRLYLYQLPLFFSSCAQTYAIILVWICTVTRKYRQGREIVTSVWRRRSREFPKRRSCTSHLHGITVPNKVNIGTPCMLI